MSIYDSRKGEGMNGMITSSLGYALHGGLG